MESGSRASFVAAVSAAFVLVGSAVLAGVIATAQPETRTIDGVVTLVESEMAKFDRDVREGLAARSTPTTDVDRLRCSAMGADALVLPGEAVVMYDEEGMLLGRGLLGPAEPLPVPDPQHGGRSRMSCRLPFQIDAIERKGNLTFVIGSRAARTYTSRELDAVDWNIELPVGA